MNRQNNILTSIGVMDSPQNRKLLLNIYNNNNIFIKSSGNLIMVDGNRMNPIEFSYVMKFLITRP